MANDTQTAFVTALGSIITGLGVWYTTRGKITEVNSSEAQSLLKLLMEERSSRESEMRQLRAEINALSDQNERLATERIKFAEEQQTVRHDLRAMLRAAKVQIEDQSLEIADLKERIVQLESLQP